MPYKELWEKLESLEEKELVEFLSKVKDWALLHGIGLRAKNNFDESSLTFAPFTLLPSPVDRRSFEQAIMVQTALNELFHTLAHHHNFLENALEKTIEHDEFTRKLYEIYNIVKEEGVSQRMCLGLLRCDYLPDSDGTLKQVEMNTIASSMSGLITQVGKAHRFVLKELGLESHLQNLPENNSLFNLCNGIVEAWNWYNETYQKSSVILFLVEEVTYNIADQRFMEFEIGRQNSNAKIIRRSLLQLADAASLGPSSELLVDNKEVAVVYFRSGYDPVQYINDSCWNVRLLLERSRAIKCPSIKYHLLGTKKVQQVLSMPGVLDNFIQDESKLKLVKDMFVDMYPLDKSEEGDKGMELALTKYEDYVLKPQREGGGHNIYGKDIPNVVKGLSRSEAASYVLMRLIRPEPSRSILVRPSTHKTTEIVSELGIYGIILGDENEIRLNLCGGHMLRSKESTATETGVAAGFGALDSPYLF